MNDNPYLLDGWLVDVAGGKISRDGVTKHLEPQVMKVLSYLAGRPNLVVTREELFSKLWRHSFVGDAALTRCIFEIRRAFGDDPQEPRVVATIPRIGFRLVAMPTALVARKVGPRRGLFFATAATLLLSLFLLQAGSDSHPESTNEYDLELATRNYENALDYLARRTRVANETAIVLFEKAIELDPTLGVAYAGLGNALGLQTLFWGGNRVADARAAANAAMRLSPAQPQAHNAYGLVRQLVGDYGSALASFEQARRLDPDDVDAMIYTADIYRRRLEFRKASDMYQQVIEREPNNPIALGQLAFLSLRMGDVHDASEWIRRAIDDDPYEPDANFQFAALQMVTGNPVAAIEICEKVQDLYPLHKGCLQILGRSNMALGKHDEAMSWFELTVDSYSMAEYALLGEAQVLIANDQKEQGLAIVEDVLQRATAAANTRAASWWDYWAIAACHSLRGDVDTAFIWLDKAADAGRRFYLWDATDTVFATLRGDERFDRYISMTRLLSNKTS